VKISNIILFSAIYCFAQVAYSANNPDASTAALVEICKNQNDQDAQNFCFGFGEGVYQAYLANRSPNQRSRICFQPTENSREMILQEFLKWHQANPQFDRERAASTLIRFFSKTYPCK
jgi:hypothetical protein